MKNAVKQWSWVGSLLLGIAIGFTASTLTNAPTQHQVAPVAMAPKGSAIGVNPVGEPTSPTGESDARTTPVRTQTRSTPSEGDDDSEARRELRSSYENNALMAKRLEDMATNIRKLEGDNRELRDSIAKWRIDVLIANQVYCALADPSGRFSGEQLRGSLSRFIRSYPIQLFDSDLQRVSELSAAYYIELDRITSEVTKLMSVPRTERPLDSADKIGELQRQRNSLEERFFQDVASYVGADRATLLRSTR